mmetsp:Transcript_6606/g.16408  ORF Transcript_6606/g.16408 Transcript_6606/m.16408 type:complete len:672 (-) Transcript_6606:361-2376(-)
MIVLLLPVATLGLLLQRPPLGAVRLEPRAALPARSVPHMIAPADPYPQRGTPLDDQVSTIDAFGTLLATRAIAAVSPLASIFVGAVLLSRGKVEKDDDANQLVGTLRTIVRKLIKPTGSTNWQYMNYTTVPDYDYTKNYPWDGRGTVSVSGCPKIFDGELNDLTMAYVFSAGKILRAILRALEIPIEIATGPLRGKGMFELSYGNIISEPEAVKLGITDDAAFAQQFLSGTNPLMIRRVTDIRKVPEEGRELVGKLKSRGTDLKALAAADKLFMVTYDVLKPYERTRKQAEDKTFLLPLPVVLLELRDNTLMPLGIQLDQSTTDSLQIEGNDAVVLPDSRDSDWASAKACVLAADSSVHEWISHLGRTHLTMEPHILAVNNKLRKHNHRVFQFLEPHLRDTLFLNVAARESLLKWDGQSFSDNNFAIGAGQVLEAAQAYWKGYDFFDFSVEGDFAARGFGPDDPVLPGYYYQHDGQKMWEVLGRYCTDFVNEFYPTDSDVENDMDLQAWAAETSDPNQANVPGFPEKIHSKVLLAKTLQAIIGIGTIHHNGVNFPQFDFMSFQPNRPSVLLTSRAGYDLYEDRHGIIKGNSDTIALLTWVLTLPSDHTLLDLTPGPFFKNDEAAKAKFAKIYQNLREDLGSLTATINARNKGLKVPYEYLRPDKVACGIDI